MSGVPTPVLVAGCGLLGLGVTVVIGLGALEREERRRRRMLAVAGPHWVAAHVPTRTWASLSALAKSITARRIAELFGMRADRAAQYPVRWWIVPIIALPLARAAAGLLSVLGGDALLLATPVFWILLCRRAYAWMDARRAAALFRQFPDALGLITRAVRVGIPVTEAIRAVVREAPAETADEFRGVSDRLSIGLSLNQALAETAHRNGVPEYRFFAAALSLQAQTGGSLAETLENLAEVIRKRVALSERARALASEAKTSAAILASLPFLTAGALAVLSPDYLMLLFADDGGKQILAVACGLLLLGVLAMRSMIRRSLS